MPRTLGVGGQRPAASGQRDASKQQNAMAALQVFAHVDRVE
jgi:hypothetical protein